MGKVLQLEWTRGNGERIIATPAAVEELLAACKEALRLAPNIASVFGPRDDFRRAETLYKAAIAKAKGREPTA